MNELLFFHMLISRIFNNNKYQISYQVSNNESEQRNFTHLIRCQTKSEAIHNNFVHISESKLLHDDSFLRKIFSLSCSTIFH
jgi:hypothetical protein